MNRKAYYSKKEIVKKYDSWRFRNYGGRYVNNKECSVINEFDLNNKETLDLPCGTGRLSSKIIKRFPRSEITCADYSEAMLKISKSRLKENVNYEKIDFFRFKEHKRYDYIFSLRFIFHYNNLNRFFSQFNKLLKKDGMLVFDNLNWSPHQIKKNFKSYVFRKKDIVHHAKINGFRLIKRKDIFILPSRLYVYLPKSMIIIIEKIENKLPKSLRSKSIWIFRKENEAE